jgi:hypothetical protein
MRAFWSRGIPPVGGKGCANLRESRNYSAGACGWLPVWGALSWSAD